MPTGDGKYHSGPLSGHFSGDKLYKTLVHHWWWQGMYTDVHNHYTLPAHSVLLLTLLAKSTNHHFSPSQCHHPFQILGVEIMDLPCTESGNKHVAVFQDYLNQVSIGVPCTRPEGDKISLPPC